MLNPNKYLSRKQGEGDDTRPIDNDQKYGIEGLPADALFDRVINIKLRRGDRQKNEEQQDYVIRSDYEVVWNANRTQYRIQRCSIKPQIRVAYKAVTGSIGIECDIYITNFHIFSESGETSLDDWSYGFKPLTQVELVMGYFPMFKKPADLKEYYGATKDEFGTLLSLDKPSRASKLILSDVSYVTTDDPPPDSVFHIHGFVNSIDGGCMTEENELLKDALEKDWFTFSNEKNSKGQGFAERLFYYLITKRFFRQPNTIPADDKEKQNWYDKEAKGLLSDNIADKYGCKVFIADGSIVKNYQVDEYLSEDLEITDDGKKRRIWLSAGKSVSGTLLMIQSKFFKNMRYAPMIDGNWVVWDADDFPLYSITDDNKGKQLRKKTLEFCEKLSKIVSKENSEMVIPMVNTISASAGLCTIVCPFFSFISPFQQLLFDSRYVYSDLSNYFARIKPQVSRFFAVSCSIDFSTTGAENKMTITATSPDNYG